MLMMLVALALTGLSSCHDDEDAPEIKPEQRTLFMYFPWSTNLTDYFYDNILAMEEAIAYTKGRVQFGKPISKFQNTQFTFADMAMRIEAARLLTYQAASIKQSGVRCSKQAAMAKLSASETAMWVTTKALQMFGGYGYTNDYPMERMMRDAKITEIYEGTSEIQRIVISANMGL